MKKLCIIIVVMAVAALAYADSHSELIEYINSAKSSASAKNYREAKQELQLALQSISEIQLAALQKFLPSAPSGWREEEIEGGDVGAFGFGMLAGLTASKKYYQGEKEIIIEIVTDSPMIGTLKVFFDNPLFLKSDPSSKIVTVNKQKALLKYDKEYLSGELSMIIGMNLITVKGNNGITADELSMFMGKIDLDGINKDL